MNIAAQAMVESGLIAEWSVWKRTPREGDDNWAHYYVFRRTTKAQDENPQNWDNWKKVIYEAFKGKVRKVLIKCFHMMVFLKIEEKDNLNGFLQLVGSV